jgi:hypothetical protein
MSLAVVERSPLDVDFSTSLEVTRITAKKSGGLEFGEGWGEAKAVTENSERDGVRSKRLLRIQSGMG